MSLKDDLIEDKSFEPTQIISMHNEHIQLKAEVEESIKILNKLGFDIKICDCKEDDK
tara:strand:- start:386 stop:556 length:171 start_codon:yes stop_codon:yes gene_type:complete